MKLYATVTSERATKGQGGEWLDIHVKGESKEVLAMITVRASDNGYSISIFEKSGVKVHTTKVQKGEKQKADCDFCHNSQCKRKDGIGFCDQIPT